MVLGAGHALIRRDAFRDGSPVPAPRGWGRLRRGPGSNPGDTFGGTQLLPFERPGSLVNSKHAYAPGGSAGPQYPHLFVETNGVIHRAMTTADDKDEGTVDIADAIAVL